ncbi:MAG: esterase [Bacteroidaceae bacterium]|nr:esterase [Bacteroidaceae bacterium]
MKKIILSLMALATVSAYAQFGRGGGNPTVPSVTENVTEDFKPASNNQSGHQYPMVNSQRMVRAQISAPNATAVGLDIDGKIYSMSKNESGVWTGTSAPQDPGFHYYQLNIDGASVPDPGSLYYYGASRWGSGIEVPSDDQDIWAVKNVPQGSVNEVFYWSTVTESMRHCYIYFPNEYYTNTTKKFPVLYLMHGMGENEHGWAEQGHTGQIMDNLIAQKKAVPFIIVIDCLDARAAGQQAGGMGGFGGFGGFGGPSAEAQAPQGQAPQGGQRRMGGGGFGMAMTGGAFQDVLLKDIIPMVEKNYRVIADPQHRAMAGLSMGGMTTHGVTLANPTTFAYVGMFSGGTFSVSELEDNADFKKTNKVLFMSCGSKENMGVMEAAENLKKIGINATGYVSEGTAHEWHTWRRSLYQFVQLCFK